MKTKTLNRFGVFLTVAYLVFAFINLLLLNTCSQGLHCLWFGLYLSFPSGYITYDLIWDKLPSDFRDSFGYLLMGFHLITILLNAVLVYAFTLFISFSKELISAKIKTQLTKPQPNKS